jgi:hypothetical protein
MLYGARDGKWSRYRNERFEFCLDVPADWGSSESLNGNGLSLAPKSLESYELRPEIRVGAHVSQPSKEDEQRPQTLDENFEAGLEALREYGGAREITVVSKQKLVLYGLPALKSTLRYKDSKSGAEWFDKDVDILDRDYTVYFIELKCHPKDADTLDQVFEKMLNSLKLHCGTHDQR